MIIFGWGFQTLKNLGPAFKNLCSNCNNEQYWILTRVITWFTIFFIPVIPYEIKHHLSCPICKYGLVLNQKQINEIKPLAVVNQLLVEGKISQEEYHARLNQLNGVSPNNVQEKIMETKVVSDGNSSFSFCTNCGDKVTEESKFCGKCGTATVIQ
jgi:hypothetical protein